MAHNNADQSNRIDRRTLLRATGAAGAAGVVGLPAQAAAQDGESDDEGDLEGWNKEQLTELDNAMKLEVAPDGRVFFTTRGADFDGETEEGVGEVGVIDPETDEVHTALELEVSTFEEDGLQGIALDPDFEDNGWVYLYYTPLDEDLEPGEGEPIRPRDEAAADEGDGDESADEDDEAAADEGSDGASEDDGSADDENGDGGADGGGETADLEPVVPEDGYVQVGDPAYIQLSRFTMDDEFAIDPDSEVGILKMPHQRESCCHVGGDVEFDSEGNLYLSTGDDTNPFETEGYAPIDESEGNTHIDAQRTSANTADLRGKVLRITPHEDGGYSIPDGNLFPVDEYADEIEEGVVRPEIYAMGLRNPFTIELDHEDDDVLYIGDYGEGAEEWSDERGALGLVQHYRTREPQNFGWPYVSGPSYPYIDYDYEADEAGEPFDPQNLVNDSPNNTGLEELPPSEPATLWYPLSWDAYLDAPDWVELACSPDEIPWPDIPEGTGAPMTGPVYYHDEESEDGALPEEYDGKQLIADWADNWFRFVDYEDDAADDEGTDDEETDGESDEEGMDDGAEEEEAGDEEDVAEGEEEEREEEAETGDADDDGSDDEEGMGDEEEAETGEADGEDEAAGDGAGEVECNHEIEPFLQDGEHASPMDMEFGPDGRLYLLEYGPGYDGEGGGVYRIEYEGE